MKDAFPYPDPDSTSISSENDVPIKAYPTPEGGTTVGAAQFEPNQGIKPIKKQ